MKSKVSVIGAGNVGATLGGMLAQSGLADVALFDIAEGMPQGKALDIRQACALWGSASRITGTNGYEDTRGSDIAVITAGLARKPGMSRDDLLRANAEIVGGAAEQVARLSPSAIVIVVTNPVDAMAYLAWKATGFPSKRVVGMGGALDSARLRAFIALELGVSPADVSAVVIGSHGDEMVPLTRLASVGGVPLTELLEKQKIEAIVQRTRHGGAEIISLLKTGSAYAAPAASAFEMLRAIMLDEKRVLPCSAYLDGQYGIKGVYAGAPVVLGKEGVEKVVEITLDEAEKSAFARSAEAIKTLIDKL